jgi:hypothetical protein
MSAFAIISVTDPDDRAEAGHAASYIIHVGGDEAYRGLLGCRQGTILPCRFESLAAGFLPFEINQTSKVGLRKIEVREAFAGARIGEIRGLKLYFDGPNQIVGLHDPTSHVRGIIRRVLRGHPDRFIFRRAIDRNEIGWIESPPTDRDAWPMRILKGFERSPRAEQTLVWQGRMDAPDLDLRPFLATAVVLHSDRALGDERPLV